MKRPYGRVGVRQIIAGRVAGLLRLRLVAEFPEQPRGNSIGDKTSRIQTIELIEERAVALRYAGHVSVIHKRLDSIF